MPKARKKIVKSSDPLEEEATPQMQPVEELLSVELFPNRIGFITHIGTQMHDFVTKQLIDYLRQNADIFAFSSADPVGIEPEITLCLNVDPKAKPEK